MKIPRPRQEGIALLEALIAIIILGIGLLGTIGLQARSYSALSDAAMRAEATIAADRLLGVMNNDVTNLANYEVALDGTPPAALTPWVNETRAAIPAARLGVTVVQEDPLSSRVDIEIRWTRKANEMENTHRVTSYVTLPKP
ncbi:prepilin-type N-terminal cleavage/methylation domain-containing protein [Massilia endophytica]|uniref:prepilin-type N-terminal cleavage/methylation domain-containing protein n=1 Tax=Massilia endophytica TaxID=2899220 RepID=UPI001E58E632|nr:prepilin-type N-terminal cleavage/methylation domain-containing protein [Massilia endophytica]UGQ48912.1 prepilin-type N-terminal cleavage/methylation domain-containing protein [Massilia endophytica]